MGSGGGTAGLIDTFEHSDGSSGGTKDVQGGSNMTGTDLCVRLYKSVPVIFEPLCISC